VPRSRCDGDDPAGADVAENDRIAQSRLSAVPAPVPGEGLVGN